MTAIKGAFNNIKEFTMLGQNPQTKMQEKGIPTK